MARQWLGDTSWYNNTMAGGISWYNKTMAGDFS
jgi:hypothetical protein